MNVDTQALEQVITEKLREVIDPETGVDVVRMGLVEGLAVDEAGVASYTFRPSSPFCPLAFPLAAAIKGAVEKVPGVSGQKIGVAGYIHADQLLDMLNE
jgi:metal-sulfur cluster biosynthetic enzyme